MADNKKQKLELTWIGKGDEPKLEPRILLENPELSHGDPHSPNMLIHGDNLLALKALEQDFAGQVKCIYIDPPYNTGSAFEHYDDGIEHSLWLSLMNQRLVLLRRLLAEDGSIWVTLDDHEMHYCKVMMDEIFGRQNFIASVIWEKSDSPRMDAVYFSMRHDYILVFSKNKSKFIINKKEEDTLPAHYDRIDTEGRQYYTKPLRAMGGQGDSREARPTLFYPLVAPDGTEILPVKQDGADGAWRWKKEKVEAEKDRIEWVRGRNGWAPYYRIYADNRTIRPAETIWSHSEVGSNRTSKAEIKKLFSDLRSFNTPKPEKLIEKILTLATNPGDLVLDSFLGSGTTAAVAHKMGRRWIGVELGEHARTHCYPRLKAVVEGEQGGISKAVGWRGGGGFRFYTLAPSLLNKDSYGNWVISSEYNAAMLAAAMAKQEGFRYRPHAQHYWKQGQSSEQDYIFTTTQFVTVEAIDQVAGQMQPGESLLICCRAFQQEAAGRHAAISIKKIPHILLGRCEFGREDYSLHIVNLPEEERPDTGEDMDTPSVQELARPAAGRRQVSEPRKKNDQPGLFD